MHTKIYGWLREAAIIENMRYEMEHYAVILDIFV